ncbi:unnamed protein product [Rhizoctonia solani]|uniref:Transmembrane protein n=1 Tax=Rhizoctonia solani TaxID=456999 RepID=A0A8H2WIQ5_9AGAM|nr:unnamed protein product [Rhizoctonia solani]
MWFRRLEYPKGQPFAIPYMAEFFYAGSVILVAVLVVVNIILAGNDVVTVLKKDPNNTDSKWWAPSWLPESLTMSATPGPCQPLTLPQHATAIRTNSTLPIFAYTILNGLGTVTHPNGTQEAKWYDALPYRSEPLETCTVQNITALVNFQDRGLTMTAQIVCDIQSQNPDAPNTLKLSTTFSRMANTDLGSDDIVDYISSYAVPRTADISKAQAVLLANNVPALKMLGVLDGVGSDILKALWAQKWAWKLSGRDNQWPDQAVVKWAAEANCTGSDSLDRCRSTGVGVEGIETWYSNTRGSQNFSLPYLRPMNTSMNNYFTVLRDALHLDLGNIDRENNVFLNADAFRARVLSDPFMSSIASDVIGVPRQPPASPGAYSEDEEEGDARQYHHITYPFPTLPHSSGPYATVFETSDFGYNNSSPDAVPRYDPMPDHVFIRAPRKGEELPPGACTLGIPETYTPKNAVGAFPSTAHISKLSLTRTVSHDSGSSVQATWDQGMRERTPQPAIPFGRPPGLSSPSPPPGENEQSALLGGYFAPNVPPASTSLASSSGAGNPIVAQPLSNST